LKKIHGLSLILIIIAASAAAIFSSAVVLAKTVTQMQDPITFGLSMYAGRPIHAEYVTSSSALAGKYIDAIKIQLKKVGSPTGTATIGIFNSDLSVKTNFTGIDVSTINTSYREYPFSMPSGKHYQVQPGDRIGIKYTGGDSSNFVAILTDQDPSGPFDGTNSYQTYFYNSVWNNFTSSDLIMTLTLTDTVPPTLTISSPPNQTSTFSTTVSVSGGASDNIAVLSITWKVDSGPVSKATGTTSWSFTTGTLSSGTHNIYVNATDVVGFVAQKLLQVKVDNTKDTFTINKMYPTKFGAREWFSKWSGVPQHTLGSGDNDPYDPMFQARGDGSTTIFGNGTAKISGSGPRMYVYDHLFNTLWNNIEITFYGKRVSESQYTSYAGLASGWGGSHDNSTYPDVCTDVPSVGKPNSAYNGRILFDGRVDYVKEVLYLRGNAQSNDGSGSSPVQKPAAFHFIFPSSVAMNDTNTPTSTSIYGTSQNTIVEYVNTSSSLINKQIDQITLQLRSVSSPSGTATVGIFKNSTNGNTNPQLVTSFGTLDTSKLASSYLNYPFKANSNYTIKSGDYIGIQYLGGSATNKMAVTYDNGTGFDGQNSYLSIWNNGTHTWNRYTGYDLTMTLTSGGNLTVQSPATDFHTMPYNTWIGYKFIIQKTSTGVHLETWMDTTNGLNGGNWVKMNSFNDIGGWSVTDWVNGYSASNWPCPNVPLDYFIKAAMPFVYVRADNVNEIDYKKFSIREINPLP